MHEHSWSVSPPEKIRIDEFLAALRGPCQVERNCDSDLNSERFEEEFRSKLLTHHFFMGSPLFQESFDCAFIAACKYAGLHVQPAPSGQRFWDVEVAGKKISLKSSKASSLRHDLLHISKLTEAAWIQDCRSARMRRRKTFELFEQYCAEVDSIIQL